MQVNDLLNQASGTVVQDTMGLVTFVGDVKSGTRGNRQWTNQFVYLKDKFGSSIGVTFWSRAVVNDLKGQIISIKSSKDGDMKVTEYNGKKQLQVAESAAVSVYEGGKGQGAAKSGVRSSPASSSFSTKKFGTPASAYGAAFMWATFLVHRELGKHFGNMKTVPECYGAMVNTLMIAYGNGQLVPDAAIEAHVDDVPKLEDPKVDAAPANEGQANGADKETQDDGPNIDPPTPGTVDDDIPF